VSEGQAYALLLAAEAGDGARFTAVWDWTATHLQRDDGLFSWRWHDGEVVDDEPAADADIDIASALLVAGERFGDARLLDEARRIAGAVLEHEVVDVSGTAVLVAGPWAVRDRIVNPSYWARCGYRRLAEATGDDRWTELGRSSLDLLSTLVTEGLPPDWAKVDDGGDVVPIGPPADPHGGARYGLDAARIPVRLSQCDDGRDVAAELWPRLDPLADDGARLAYQLDGTPAVDDRHPTGLVGASAAALAAGEADIAAQLLRTAAQLQESHPTYYGAAWVALGETLDNGSHNEPPILELAGLESDAAHPPTRHQDSAAAQPGHSIESSASESVDTS
jgi:endo-1,4-beta-D-glucanase Y